MDDLIPKLADVKCITVIDMKSGYWQVPLDEHSSYLPNFDTPWGCFHYTRVAFGMTVSGNIFQCKLDAVYKNVKNVTGIDDDILMLGYDEGGSDIVLTE